MANQMLEQMLEHLVNDEQDKAEELFHEYVVAKSREIYEGLVEDQWDEEVVEADDEDMMGGDATDDLEDEITDDEEDMDMDDMDMDDEEDEGEEDTEELFQDLEDIVGELEAKFAELQGEADDEEETEESFAFEADEDEEEDEEVDESDSFEEELASLREYVEKVSGGAASSETTADNKKSVVDNMKNDMGGTNQNILGDSTDEKGRSAPTAKEENMGNVNVPGGKASKSMSKASGGADSSEKNADNTDSVLRSQR